jgi:diguanylate cyclase (GGDEF)-like protein/PAS domain S-box-containing protein
LFSSATKIFTSFLPALYPTNSDWWDNLNAIESQRINNNSHHIAGCLPTGMRILKRDIFFLFTFFASSTVCLALPARTGGELLAGPLNILSIGAVFWGLFHYRPADKRPWLLLGIGQILRFVGDILWYVLYGAHQVTTYPYFPDLAFLLGILCSAAALTILGHSKVKSHNRSYIIDALITAIGTGVMMAGIVVTPLEKTLSQTFLQNTVTVSYPILITLTVLSAVKLIAPAARRTRTNVLVAISTITYAAGIAMHLITVVNNPGEFLSPTGPLITVAGFFFSMAYISLAAAATHPQMAEPATEIHAAPVYLSWKGIALLAAAALLVPVTLVYSVFNAYPFNAWLIAAGSGAITLLIFAKQSFLTFDLLSSQKELALASIVFENANEGIFIVDAGGRIISANNAFATITGFGQREVLGKTIDFLRSDRYTEKDFEAIATNILSSENWRGELHIKRKDGEEFPILLTASFLRNQQGLLTNGILLFTDITDWKASEERLRHQANHDSLTGLPNRAFFRDLLVQALERSARHGILGAVMFLDIDYFKTINDRLGHDQGDILLQTIAERLRIGLRGSDIVARLGGDEFVVLVEDLHSPQDAARAAERLQEFFQQPVRLANGVMSVTCSIGISLFPSDGTNVQEILKKADIALYRAKDSGRSTYRFFRTPAPHS